VSHPHVRKDAFVRKVKEIAWQPGGRVAMRDMGVCTISVKKVYTCTHKKAGFDIEHKNNALVD
jgi:hypothetical protein